MLLIGTGALVALVMGAVMGWSIAGHVRRVGVWTLEIVMYVAGIGVIGFAIGMMATALLAGW